MANNNDSIRDNIEDFTAPVAQMFRNIGTNISDAVSDLGDAVTGPDKASAKRSDESESKGGCLKPLLYLLAIMLLFSMCGTDEEYDPANDIAMVQSGYLGEYTDVPVKDLLWFLYSNISDSQEWDGFYSDKGYPIVQVTYSRDDAPDSPAIFQFSIADQQFVLSGYRDPLAEVEEITDLYALLNYTYLEWRSQNYSGDFPYDPTAMWPMSANLTATSTTATAQSITMELTLWNMRVTTKMVIVTEPEPAIIRTEKLPTQANGNMMIISKTSS